MISHIITTTNIWSHNISLLQWKVLLVNPWAWFSGGCQLITICLKHLWRTSVPPCNPDNSKHCPPLRDIMRQQGHFKFFVVFFGPFLSSFCSACIVLSGDTLLLWGQVPWETWLVFMDVWYRWLVSIGIHMNIRFRNFKSEQHFSEVINLLLLFFLPLDTVRLAVCSFLHCVPLTVWLQLYCIFTVHMWYWQLLMSSFKSLQKQQAI